MKNNNKLLACPYIIWMILFTIIPLGIVFYYALTDSITGQFTLANLSGMGTYLPIFLRSIWLSLFASLICLLIGYPVAYFIAQCRPLTQRFLEMLIMLPMCMSFLLRTLAWVGMLEDTGILNTLLQRIGIGPLPLIRTNGAVILGMVYNYLPYMILPLYTVSQHFRALRARRRPPRGPRASLPLDEPPPSGRTGQVAAALGDHSAFRRGRRFQGRPSGPGTPRRPSRRGGARSAPAAPHGRISSNKKAAY